MRIADATPRPVAKIMVEMSGDEARALLKVLEPLPSDRALIENFVWYLKAILDGRLQTWNSSV